MSDLSDPFVAVLVRDRQARLEEAARLRLQLSVARQGKPGESLGVVVRAHLGRALARAGVWAVRHGNAWAREARRPA